MAVRINDHRKLPFDPNLYDDKCVSQICQCGNHKCPPPDFTKAVKFDQPILAHHTQEKGKCKGKKTKKKCNCKCKHPNQVRQHAYQERHYDPNSIQSVYQVDFQGKYVEQDPLKRSNGHGHTGVFQHGSNAPFMGNTEYNTQFTGKLVEKDLSKSLQIFHPVQPRPPFDGTTTYNASYQGKYVEKQWHVPQTKVVQRPYVPFDGTTEYNAKYQYVAVEGGDCQSCCGCESEDGGSCDCDADSLDGHNVHNQPQHPTVYQQTVPVYPPFTKQHLKAETGLKQAEQNIDCPVKKLPEVPKRCQTGKSHTKYQAKKNIWR